MTAMRRSHAPEQVAPQPPARPAAIGSPRRHGFTLVELLVVIGIIALLVAILLPTLQKAREAAKLTACMSNVRQFGIAIQMYANDYHGVWPRYYAPAPGGGWTDAIITTSFAYGNDGSTYPLGRYGIGLLYPYLKQKNVFFCPNGAGVPLVDSSKDLEWGTPTVPYLYSSYCLRSIWNTDRNDNLLLDEKLPEKVRGPLSKYTLVSCWFMYYLSGNALPISYHKLKYPVLFGDGHADIGLLDKRINTQNPPNIYGNWGWQCYAWDSFDKAPQQQ
jgi:prepilin-type N-terminal cleavage/methylation domain-containing protein